MKPTERKTRVLHIIRSLERGGAERLVVNYARFLDRDRFETHICCLDRGGSLLKEAQQVAAGVYVLRRRRLGLLALIRLIRILRRQRIDVVHTHNFSAHLWGSIAGFICRAPCVVGTEHNVVFDERHRLIKRFRWHLFDRVIAVSQAVASSHRQRWKIPDRKLVVIRNGVALNSETSKTSDEPGLVAPLDVPEGDKIVLNVGNLTEQKAQHLFIEAAAQVLERYPKASFLIIGEGEERPELQKLIEEMSLQEKVKLLGSREDVPAIVARSSLLVLSSLWEGLPLTILEAMAAGKPVVVTDVGGNREAVRDEETGYIVPKRRTDLLVDRILRLLDNETLAEQMGTRGRLRYEAEFRAEIQVRKTEDLYDMLLRARRKEIVPKPLAGAPAAQPARIVYVMGMGIMGSGGGAERQLIELLKRIDRKRYSPVVCSIFPASSAHFQRGSNWEMINKLEIPIYGLPKRTKAGPLTFFQLYRLMRRERPQIVHSYCFSANWRATAAAVCARVPAIISSDRNVNDWMKWYHRLMERVLSKFRDAIIVNAVALKDFLIEKENIPTEKIHVIYNGVDVARFETVADAEEVKRELGISPQWPIVGLVAVLSEKKDIPTFLKAAVRVKHAYPESTFLIVGDGPARSELEELAHELGLTDYARFLGHSNEVPRLISAMNVTVLSSLREGCSNTILESMAAAKPIVATDVGGNRELIDDGQTGFLVPVGDDQTLAGKIIYLLENRELSARMGISGRQKKVEQVFSVDRMVTATQQVYNRFLERRD